MGRFEIRAPRRKASARRRHRRSPLAAIPGSPRRRPRMSCTILTVDDSPSLRQMVRLALADAGYQVLEAPDGVAGLELARQHDIAVVITDQTMPRMDGVSLVAALRALPAYAKRPIIVLTTETDPEIKARARAAGATGWMNKPFNPERLLEVVAKVLPGAPPA
jgi:two-component system chemotaxis response regulator CheY